MLKVGVIAKLYFRIPDTDWGKKITSFHIPND